MSRLTEADIAAGLALFDIFAKAKATLDALKNEAPDVYAEIERHHSAAKAAAKAVDPD